MDSFNRLIEQHNIDRVYRLPLVDYERPKQFASAATSHLEYDLRSKYPQAKCLLMLVKSYQGFKMRSTNQDASEQKQPTLSAYYIASNSLYHAGKEIIEQLESHGNFAEKVDIPIKTAFLTANIGQLGRNSLLAIDELGSRFCAQAIVTDAFEAEMIENCIQSKNDCEGCKRCIQACPVGAIDEKGLGTKKCMRTYMDGQAMPQWVMERIPTLLGCEICQQVCLRNANIPAIDEPINIEALFTFENIFEMNAEKKKEIVQYVGKNMLSGGRLRAQALCIAKKMGIEDLPKIIENLGKHNASFSECETKAIQFVSTNIEKTDSLLADISNSSKMFKQFARHL